MERRTFLAAGSATVLAFTTRPPLVTSVSGDPAGVVREYYRRASAAESDDAVGAIVRSLSYSASPLRELATTNPSPFDGVRQTRLVSASVVAENVGVEEIRERSDFFAAYVGDTTVERIAEENAVVAVTLDTDQVGGRLAKEWLVAPEDGEWRLVWPGERNSPEAAARGFFRGIARTTNTDDLVEGVAEFSHSRSPLPDLAADNPAFFDGTRRRRLASASVVAENVGVERIADEFTPFARWTSESTVAAIAEENAVVAMSFDADGPGSESTVQEWLLAPDDGDWRVVWL